jgi:hypothetical protein
MSESPVETMSHSRLKIPRLRPWREGGILALMVMAASWFVPWYLVLTPARDPVSPLRAFAILFGMTLVAHWIVRVMHFFHLKMALRRVTLLSSMVLGIYAGLWALLYHNQAISLSGLLIRPVRAFVEMESLVPPEFIIILIILLMWWRGIRLAQGYLSPSMVIRHFQVGATLFVLFILFNTLTTGEDPTLFFFLFLFSGLFAMSAARFSILSAYRGSRRIPFDRRWFLGLVLAVLGAVGLSTGLAALAMGGGSLIVRVVVRLIVGILLIMALPFLLALIYLLEWLVDTIRFEDSLIADMMRDLGERLQGLVGLLSDLFEPLFGYLTALAGLLREWGPALRLLICVGTLILVGGAVLISLKVRARREDARGEEERDSLLDGQDIFGLLGKSLRARLREFTDLLLSRGLGGLGRRKTAARIRRIYARLLRLCADLGEPRPAAATPLEFQPRMEKLFPHLTEDLAIITRAYIQVHYGEVPEHTDTVKAVEAAWKRVSESGDEARTALKRGG